MQTGSALQTGSAWHTLRARQDRQLALPLVAPRSEAATALQMPGASSKHRAALTWADAHQGLAHGSKGHGRQR